MTRPDLDTSDLVQLTPEQANGRACIRCGGWDGPMVPVATIVGALVFAHVRCDRTAYRLEPLGRRSDVLDDVMLCMMGGTEDDHEVIAELLGLAVEEWNSGRWGPRDCEVNLPPPSPARVVEGPGMWVRIQVVRRPTGG